MNEKYDAIKKMFQFDKIVDLNQLKRQLLYGQFNLDATTFEQLYECNIDNFKYKDFKIYVLSEKFDKNDIEKFIDQIYNVVSNDILKKFAKNVEFKQKLENYNIAQVDSGILEITEYNAHAFIHQIGHEIYSSLNNNILTVICNNFYSSNSFPSNLSRKNLNEYFAQLFAYYHLNRNKLTVEQLQLIEQYVFNKKIRKAKIKLWKIGRKHYYYDKIVESKRKHQSKKLKLYSKNHSFSTQS